MSDFDKDFDAVSSRITFKDAKQRYNTKQQLKKYDDNKIIKQLFNLCVRLIYERSEKHRAIRKNLQDEIDELKRTVLIKTMHINNLKNPNRFDDCMLK